MISNILEFRKDQIFSKETVFVERKNQPQRPPRDPIQSAKTIYTISMRKNSENRSDLSKNESSVRSKSPYSTFKSLKEEQNRYFSSVKKVDSPLNQSTSTQKPSFPTKPKSPQIIIPSRSSTIQSKVIPPRDDSLIRTPELSNTRLSMISNSLKVSQPLIFGLHNPRFHVTST